MKIRFCKECRRKHIITGFSEEPYWCKDCQSEELARRSEYRISQGLVEDPGICPEIEKATIFECADWLNKKIEFETKKEVEKLHKNMFLATYPDSVCDVLDMD